MLAFRARRTRGLGGSWLGSQLISIEYEAQGAPTAGRAFVARFARRGTNGSRHVDRSLGIRDPAKDSRTCVPHPAGIASWRGLQAQRPLSRTVHALLRRQSVLLAHTAAHPPAHLDGTARRAPAHRMNWTSGKRARTTLPPSPVHGVSAPRDPSHNRCPRRQVATIAVKVDDPRARRWASERPAAQPLAITGSNSGRVVVDTEVTRRHALASHRKERKPRLEQMHERGENDEGGE